MRAILVSAMTVLSLGMAFVASPLAKRAMAAPAAPAGETLTELRVRDVVPLVQAHQAAVILTPTTGDLVLPVLVSEDEGEALAGQIHGHGAASGLVQRAIAGLGGKLVRVELSRVEGENVVARVVVDQNGKAVSFEAGAADTLSIALENHLPVLATRAVIDGMGLTRSQIRELARGAPASAPAVPPGVGQGRSGGAHALDTQGGGISL